LAKAQSDGTLDVTAAAAAAAGGSGMVGGVYLPRRTRQRRISHAVGLSADAAPAGAKQQMHHYRPFLKPTPEHARHVARQQQQQQQRPAPPLLLGTHVPPGGGAETDRRRESTQQRNDTAKQVLCALSSRIHKVQCFFVIIVKNLTV